MSNLEEEQIPKSTKIAKYTYSFKEKIDNNSYGYRCRTRKCGVLILLNESHIQKIINTKESELVEFTKLSKKDHTYQENNIFISNNEIQTYNENIQFAEDLIKKI